MEKAVFGAGCFWHIQDRFNKVKGVSSTSVGYSGGDTNSPNYEQVCTGNTGHAEVVEIDYDPKVVTYSELLSVFWACHDPTTKDRQGPDIKQKAIIRIILKKRDPYSGQYERVVN